MRALRGKKLNDLYDLVIIGSGFAGSLLAMIARRLGHSVALVEKGTHPRVVIGESSTPLSNLLLEELATRYHLPALQPLSKWGTWQKACPQIAVGLKRGFTFHHHRPGSDPSSAPGRQDQLLVAASPRDQIADTHWYRADFDRFLVLEAQNLGVSYFDQVDLRSYEEAPDSVFLRGSRAGRNIGFRARFVVDATGPRGCLHRLLQLGETEWPGYPLTQALYSHFSGVGRLKDSGFDRTAMNTPPYPVDDAAVHHIFDDGWIWVLQFNNGITSAGVVATDAYASKLRFCEGEPAWRRMLDQIPALKAQFATGKSELPFTHLAQLSFRSAAIVGRRWALLPSAAGFVDPLLSTGFPLTLLGVTRVSKMLEQDWGTPAFLENLRRYARQTDAELLATAELLGALYANMSNPAVFNALTMLYFAAASFSESARRLGKTHLASSFLLCNDPGFGPAIQKLTKRAREKLTSAESQDLIRDIRSVIEPYNIAGLGRPDRLNWYPVDAQDLYDGAAKLGSTREEIQQMLGRCGFMPDSAPGNP